MKKDVVIIGAGPAGIFTALEMLRKGSKKSILIVEKGKSVENRRCPKNVTGKCMNCKPFCHITTGFSGAGAFSDGKLSLSAEVTFAASSGSPPLSYAYYLSLRASIIRYSINEYIIALFCPACQYFFSPDKYDFYARLTNFC